MRRIPAIPTTYGGVHFRSRLEARFAALFDLHKLRWEFEALDQRGWIPDFVLFLDLPVLVECKPAVDHAGFKKAQRKAERSNTEYPVLIVGASLCLTDDEPDLLARCRETPDSGWRACTRLTWPESWGTCPFLDSQRLFEAWRAAGNASQWLPPK